MDIEIIAPIPDNDTISVWLRQLTEAIDKFRLADGKAGGLFGGTWGYGANFENDVFMMHRYCWCERDDCLWCGADGCQGEIECGEHAAECYLTALEILKQKYGKEETWGWCVPFDHPEYKSARTALCVERGLDPELGCECHCDCGAEASRERRYAECQCDWHTGSGLYRFGKATPTPNFWHKASGAQVRWYKYIGRGMETVEPKGQSWKSVFEECLASLK